MTVELVTAGLKLVPAGVNSIPESPLDDES